MTHINSSKLMQSSFTANNTDRDQVITSDNTKCPIHFSKDKHSTSRKIANNNLSKSTVNFNDKQNTGSSCFSQLEQDCLKTIITQNAKYYQDKTKVCCSTKPTKHRLMLPSHTGNSIYKQDFIPKEGFDPATSLRFQQFKSKSPFMNTSNYNSSFVIHKISPRKKSLQNFDFSDDAPRFLQSQYKGDFKKWDTKADNIKVEYPQNYILGMGDIAKKSVYGSDFVPKGNNRLASCKYPDSTMFADYNVPMSSQYQDQFTKKPHYDSSNFKMKNTYLPTVGLPNYNSQYKSQYDPKKKKGCSYKKILTVQELQSLILNI